MLNKKFYQQGAIIVARKLLGKYLVYQSCQGKVVGMITETEAYLGSGDEASHSSRGLTKRNRKMFEEGGRAYVYQIYGMYYCFNIVTGKENIGEAVLIRALEPVQGVGLMQRRRGVKNLHQLCNGPAKLVIAMGITKNLDGARLTKKPLYVEQGKIIQKEMIHSTTRVGITRSAHLPLRFYLKNNRFISKK